MTRPRWRSIAWFVAGLLAVTVWHGSLRQSAGPAAGEHLGFENTPIVARPLRIATFNIHACKGRDGIGGVQDTISAASADLVGLNEVHRDWLSDSNQATTLGKLLEMQGLFAPAEHRWWHDHFGNGVLANGQVRRWQRIPLPQTSKTFRNAVLVDVAYEQRIVHVLITHLDRLEGDGEREQLRVVGDLFLALEPPAILMGDMNVAQSHPSIQKLLAEPGVIDAVATPLGANDKPRVDWILCRGLKPVEAGLIDNGASDHPLVWAALEIEGTP